MPITPDIYTHKLTNASTADTQRQYTPPFTNASLYAPLANHEDPSRTSNNTVNATICVAVLYLPRLFTLTAACASPPFAAHHSRNALMVISRPIITIDGSATAQGATPAGARVHNKHNDAATINLSATGSKNAPNALLALSLRARYPSSQSVNAANMNITPAMTAA